MTAPPKEGASEVQEQNGSAAESVMYRHDVVCWKCQTTFLHACPDALPCSHLPVVCSECGARWVFARHELVGSVLWTGSPVNHR